MLKLKLVRLRRKLRQTNSALKLVNLSVLKLTRNRRKLKKSITFQTMIAIAKRLVPRMLKMSIIIVPVKVNMFTDMVTEVIEDIEVIEEATVVELKVGNVVVVEIIKVIVEIAEVVVATIVAVVVDHLTKTTRDLSLSLKTKRHVATKEVAIVVTAEIEVIITEETEVETEVITKAVKDKSEPAEEIVQEAKEEAEVKAVVLIVEEKEEVNLTNLKTRPTSQSGTS